MAHVDPNRLAYQGFGFVIFCFLGFMIYRRKAWARWILAGVAALWAASLALHLRQLIAHITTLNRVALVLQLVLWVVAILMLFAPTANEWFRPRKESA